MADLEALSAPNRSIWQPISYMNPIDTYVGNKGKLAALKATDLEFQKADSTIQTTKDATKLVRNLQGDNPYVKELADKNEAELSRISELKDPYEMQKQTKVLANSFAKQINDTNSQLGATVQAYIKSEENLKNAKNDTDKTVALEKQAQHNNSDENGKSGVSKYYNPVTESYQGALDNLQMNHYDKYDNIEDDAHATFTNYAKDQTALAGFGLQSRKGADGKFEITSKSSNSGITREEADRAANNMFEANAKIQDQFKNKALAAASEKIFNAKGKRGLVQTTKEGQDLYNEEYNKLKDSYVGYIKDKLAHNQHDETIQGRANAETADDAIQKRRVKAAQEEYIKTVTGGTTVNTAQNNPYNSDYVQIDENKPPKNVLSLPNGKALSSKEDIKKAILEAAIAKGDNLMDATADYQAQQIVNANVIREDGDINDFLKRYGLKAIPYSNKQREEFLNKQAEESLKKLNDFKLPDIEGNVYNPLELFNGKGISKEQYKNYQKLAIKNNSKLNLSGLTKASNPIEEEYFRNNLGMMELKVHGSKGITALHGKDDLEKWMIDNGKLSNNKTLDDKDIKIANIQILSTNGESGDYVLKIQGDLGSQEIYTQGSNEFREASKPVNEIAANSMLQGSDKFTSPNNSGITSDGVKDYQYFTKTVPNINGFDDKGQLKKGEFPNITVVYYKDQKNNFGEFVGKWKSRPLINYKQNTKKYNINDDNKSFLEANTNDLLIRLSSNVVNNQNPSNVKQAEKILAPNTSSSIYQDDEQEQVQE